MTLLDEGSAKNRETGFYEKSLCFQNSLFLNSLKMERLLYRKPLVLLNVCVGIGALGKDCGVETI